MRGSVYRLGRRRTGSIVLAMGVAFAFALGGTPAAMAKAHAAAAKKSPAVTAYRGQARVQAKPSVLARAAGHKIA
jgi:hypothetical protein